MLAPLLWFRRCRIGDPSSVCKPKALLTGYLVAFAEVVFCPERLKVCVMKCGGLLYRIGEIKLRQRDDVVDVPAVATTILPRHARQELALKPATQLAGGASDILKRAGFLAER
jgi:hypothetical protein